MCQVFIAFEDNMVARDSHLCQKKPLPHYPSVSLDDFVNHSFHLLPLSVNRNREKKATYLAKSFMIYAIRYMFNRALNTPKIYIYFSSKYTL